MTRKEAKEKGLKTYDADKSCKYCGSHKRYASSCGCYDCQKKSGLKKLANKELMDSYKTAEKNNNRLRGWRKANPDKLHEQRRRSVSRRQEHYKNNRSLYKHRSLKKYGLTIEQYNEMLDNQNGVCWICKESCKTGRSLAVDHCHKSAKVRGLLCAKCNRSLGCFNDSIDCLKEAIRYLEVFSCP